MPRKHNVFITCYGVPQAQRLINALDGAPSGRRKSDKLVAFGVGTLQKCKRCHARGHSQDECKIGSILRLDASLPISPTIIECLESLIPGCKALAGANPSGNATKAKHFAHLYFEEPDQELDQKVAVALAAFTLMGLISSWRVLPKGEMPSCCSACGLRKQDTPINPKFFTKIGQGHKAGDTQCPLHPKNFQSKSAHGNEHSAQHHGSPPNVRWTYSGTGGFWTVLEEEASGSEPPAGGASRP
jgi:hypothetical protein